MGDASPARDARKWQGPRARTKNGRAPGKSRVPLALGLLGAILALAGALVALLFYLQPAPQPLLVVLRTEYRDPLLPVSPWGDQDRAVLREAGLKTQDAFTSQDRDRLREELKNVGHDLKPDQPLVIYLSAYAAGTANGDVALLPADARLDDPASWLSIKEVLEALKNCRAKHKRRLLLLDLAQPCTTPRGGLLVNDVAERLQTILEAALADDPDLQVLTACSPGQVSLSSEELGNSVFAYYVALGLRGHADGCLPNQTPNHEVTVQELQTYVTTQVQRWAWHNRGARQTPVFLGSKDDYGLTRQEGPTTPDPPTPHEYALWLQRPWKERDRWWNDHTSSTPAALYRQLESDALRAEQRWRGGEDEGKVKAFLDPRVDSLLVRRRAEKVGGDGGEPRSLAQVVAAGQAAPALTPDAQRDFLELAALYVAAKRPMANDKDVKALPQDTARLLKKYEGQPFDLAWTVFAVALAESPPRQEHLRCWYELLQPEGQPPPAYNETRFLKSLIGLKPDKPADWPADAVAEALRLTAEAEWVEARNPTLQPWLKAEHAEAVRKRADAEELLFNPDARKRAEAPKTITEALRRYGSLRNKLGTLNDAQRLRDEGLVFLPAYVPYLEFDDANEKEWAEAVRTTRALEDVLSRPAGGATPDTLGRLDELVTTLRNNLSKLRRPLDSVWVKKPFDQSLHVSGTDAQLISVLLQLPGWSAPDRLTLWNNYRTVADRLNREALAPERSAEQPPSSNRAEEVRAEQKRALLRARASLALLQLAKAADLDKVEAELQKVTAAPTDKAAWLSLARVLRQAWKQNDIDRARSEKN
jgi:hypothetical protein